MRRLLVQFSWGFMIDAIVPGGDRRGVTLACELQLNCGNWACPLLLLAGSPRGMG